VKEIIDQGGLVDDELMASLVQGRLGEDDTRTSGWVLDGFPRTLGQALSLDRITEVRPVNCVINLDVPKDVVLARLTVRREAEQRTDDSPEAVARRLELYEPRPRRSSSTTSARSSCTSSMASARWRRSSTVSAGRSPTPRESARRSGRRGWGPQTPPIA
jgi:adenylate kinase family enzyme